MMKGAVTSGLGEPTRPESSPGSYTLPSFGGSVIQSLPSGGSVAKGSVLEAIWLPCSAKNMPYSPSGGASRPSISAVNHGRALASPQIGSGAGVFGLSGMHHQPKRADPSRTTL